MLKFPLPPHEMSRLSALGRYQVLDTMPEPAFDEFAKLAAYIVGTPSAMVTLVDADRLWVKSAVGDAERKELPREYAFCSHAICSPDTVFVVEDASKDERFRSFPSVAGEQNLRFYAGAPIVTADGYALGALCVVDTQPRRMDDVQRTALQTLARSVMSVMELGLRTRELESSNKMLERISLTDTLTSVGNRLAFQQRMAEEAERCQRYSHPLSLLVLDIDHFKNYNDTHGHLAGDQLLRQFAARLVEVVRGSDCVYRYGGEEFVVILPETDFNGATIIAGRVRDGINATNWQLSTISASIGIASAEQMVEPEKLFEQADKALYWVKSHGRNAVQHFDLIQPGEAD